MVRKSSPNLPGGFQFPYENLGFPTPEVFLQSLGLSEFGKAKRSENQQPFQASTFWRSPKKPANLDLFRFSGTVSFLLWGSKNVKLTPWLFHLQIHPIFPQKTTLKGMIGALIPIYIRILYTPYKKERLASWYLTGRDLNRSMCFSSCFSSHVILFRLRCRSRVVWFLKGLGPSTP